MLLDEARIVSRLRHPNIVGYYELGSEDGNGLHRDGAPHRAVAVERLGGDAAPAGCAFATT